MTGVLDYPDPISGDDLRRVLEQSLEQLVAGVPLRQSLNHIAHQVSLIASFSACWILLLDEQGERRTGGSWNMDEYDERIAAVRLSVAERELRSPSARALHFGEPILIEDLLADPTFSAWRSVAIEYDIRSMMSVPLIIAGDVIGVLNGYRRDRHRWLEEEASAVQSLVHHAAVAVHIAALLDRQRENIAKLNEANAELERRRVTLERAGEIHAELTSAVVDGLGFEEVTERLAAALGRPVAIWDAAGRMTHAAPAGHRAECEQLRPLPAADGRGGSRLDVLQSEIVVGQQVTGYITAQDPGAGCSELDRRALQHAASVLALVFVNARVASETEERLRAGFLQELVTSRTLQRQWIVERGWRYGFRLGNPYRVLITELIGWPQYISSAQLSETAEAPRLAEAFRRVATSIEAELPGSLTSRSGHALITLVPGDSVSAVKEKLMSVAHRVRTEWAREFGGVAIRCAIGGPGIEPEELRRSYSDAQRCLRIVRGLGSGRHVIAAEDLGFLAPLMDTRDPATLTNVADRVLGPLLRYDRAKGGTLVETLRVLLAGNGAPEQAASVLHVHPNTVRYRIRQIEELSSLDLRSAQNRLELALACAIESVRSELAAPVSASA